MVNIICFSIGVIIGGNIGFILCALLSANGDDKDDKNV